jgi:hypothetical protein
MTPMGHPFLIPFYGFCEISGAENKKDSLFSYFTFLQTF